MYSVFTIKSTNTFRLDMMKRAMPMDPGSKPTLRLLKLSKFPRGLFEDGSVNLKFLIPFLSLHRPVQGQHSKVASPIMTDMEFRAKFIAHVREASRPEGIPQLCLSPNSTKLG